MCYLPSKDVTEGLGLVLGRHLRTQSIVLLQKRNTVLVPGHGPLWRTVGVWGLQAQAIPPPAPAPTILPGFLGTLPQLLLRRRLKATLAYLFLPRGLQRTLPVQPAGTVRGGRAPAVSVILLKLNELSYKTTS